MTDTYKQKKELVAELEAARQRIAELESEKDRRRRAEDVLRKNAEFLRGILDTAAAGVFVADREGTVAFANPRIEEFTGSPLEKLIGRSCLLTEWPWADFSGRPIPPEEDPFLHVRDTGKRVVNFPITFPRPNGGLGYYVINAAPLRDRDGSITHVVFGIQDISEQKHAEAAYRVLVEDSPQGLSLYQDDRLVYANQALADIGGCRVEDLIGLSPIEIAKTYFHPADLEPSLAAYEAVISGERSAQPIPYRIYTRGGALRYVESYVSQTTFEGRPAVQIVTFDVTKRKEAEKTLEDTRMNLQELFDRIEDFVFVLSLEGRIVHVNPALVNRLGYSGDELRGAPLSIVHPKQQRSEAEEILRAILARKRGICELPLQTANGKIIPVETKVSLGVWNGEQVLYGLSRDISDRLKAQEQIHESERRFREALNASPHVLFRHNVRENRYDYVSRSIEEYSVYSHDEFMTKGPKEVIPQDTHPDDLARVEQAMKDAVENAQGNSAHIRIEVRRRAKDGTYHWMSDSLALLLDDQGALEAVVGSVHDIENLKRAEEALRESEERYRLLADNSVDMISRHAPDGTVLFVSPACESLSGYTPDELLGKPAEFLLVPDDIEEAWSAVKNAGETDGRYVSQHRMRRKDGAIIWVETTGRVLRDTSGNITEIQCAVRDITARKRAQADLRKRDLQLRKVLQAAPVILFAADLDGTCTFFEGRGLKNIGVHPEEYLGASMLDYYANRPQMRAWFERTLAGEEFSAEYIHEPSGRILMGHASQLYDDAGNREGVVVVSVDITEQHHAERAYHALVDHSLQGLSLVRNGKVIFSNAQAAALTGYSQEELQALSPDEMFALILPADHALVLDRIQRRQCGEDLPPLFHLRIIRKDGEVRTLLVSTTPVEHDGGTVIQVAFLDVTDFPEARYGAG